MWDGSQKGENPSERGKNKIQWITDLPAGLRGRVILGKGNRMEELIKRLERVIQTGAPDKDGMHPISAETVLEVVKGLSEHGTNLAEVGTDAISRQAAIDAVKKNTFRLTFAEEQNCEGHVAWSAEAVYSDVMEGALLELPSAQLGQRYTNEELMIFQHGISLRLVSKRSAQHWRYDENTATEIKFLERLYEKVSANMRGGQNE